MKNSMIEKYYIDQSGEPKVVMDQNTANDIAYAMEAYRAAEKSVTEGFCVSEEGIYIAERFLADEDAKKYLAVGNIETPRYEKYRVFFEAVEAKVNELLGIKLFK